MLKANPRQDFLQTATSAQTNGNKTNESQSNKRRATARWEVSVVQAVSIPLMPTAFFMGPGPQEKESELQAHSLLKSKTHA